MKKMKNMMAELLSLLLLASQILCVESFAAEAFSRPSTTITGRRRRTRVFVSDNGESSSASSSSSSSSSGFFESLRARQQELDSQKNELQENWKKANCLSTIPIGFPDWVRRLDVGEYPLVACGSSSGNIFVGNLETGTILAQTEGEEFKQQAANDNKMKKDMIKALYNGYDGGGTIAIAMHKGLICSSARQGSVQVWRLDESDGKIIAQGTMKALEGKFVTCLELDDDHLWVTTADGYLQAYAYRSNIMPLTLQARPELEWKFDSPILDLSLSPKLGYGVVCTLSSDNQIHVFSMDDDDKDEVLTWSPELGHKLDEKDESSGLQGRNNRVQSATLVPLEDDEESAAIVCGTREGALIVNFVDLDNNNDEDDNDDDDNNDGPVFRKTNEVMQPRHSAALKCLASPSPGLLITGAQDGCIRLWNISPNNSHYMYQFVGYKVWLGSIWTDGTRLLSDGADNTVVLHDFSKSKKDIEGLKE